MVLHSCAASAKKNATHHQSGPGKGDGILETARDLIQDTEGFVAANDDVLLVVFRGTSEAVDWLTNLRGIPRGVAWCPDRERCSIHRVSELTVARNNVLLYKVCFFLLFQSDFSKQQAAAKLRNASTRP